MLVYLNFLIILEDQFGGFMFVFFRTLLFFKLWGQKFGLLNIRDSQVKNSRPVISLKILCYVPYTWYLPRQLSYEVRKHRAAAFWESVSDTHVPSGGARSVINKYLLSTCYL